MRVLNFGSLNIDYVYQVPHAVRPGETLASLGMNVFCGGKGLNQSIALARAGVPVYHAGLIGEDGEMLRTLCKDNKVNCEYVRQVEGKNGHTIIQVDEHGENCILLYGGSNQKVSKEFAEEVLADFKEGDVLLLQNEISELPYIIKKAAEKKMTIVLNPSPYDEGIEACDLQQVSIFMINEIEGEQLTGKKEPEQIMKEMHKRFPAAKIVLTLGEKGVVYAGGDVLIHREAVKVTAVDTTAAGDTFTGYFISGLLQGLSIEEILSRCVTACAITVSRPGAADSIPTVEEVEQVWHE